MTNAVRSFPASLGRLQQQIPTRWRARLRRAYYLTLPSTSRRGVLAHWFRNQARRCGDVGSALYADLLRRAAADIENAGSCWAPLDRYAPDPGTVNDLLPLRFMAGVHGLVLEGRAPALAPYYADPAAAIGDEGCWKAFRDVVEGERERVRAWLDRCLQTNEVGRCRVLLGGFLAVARTTHRPLRLLEVGASAGLNLRWDHYRYETPGAAWGPADSPVRLAFECAGGLPPFDVAARVVERRGCDLAPVDATSDDGARALLAYLWPDRPERLALLRGALEVARRVPAAVERGEACEWLAGALAARRTGVATVVFHSAVMLYLPRRARARLGTLVADAGRRADADAPLAWLAFEQDGRDYALRLTTWPGGRERVLATADTHGGGVRWLAAA